MLACDGGAWDGSRRPRRAALCARRRRAMGLGCGDRGDMTRSRKPADGHAARIFELHRRDGIRALLSAHARHRRASLGFAPPVTPCQNRSSHLAAMFYCFSCSFFARRSNTAVATRAPSFALWRGVPAPLRSAAQADHCADQACRRDNATLRSHPPARKRLRLLARGHKGVGSGVSQARGDRP